MSNNSVEGAVSKGIDNTKSAHTEAGTSNLQQLAYTLYECKGGGLVTNPKECRDSNMLPPMDVSQISKV